jgi:hypothetical protein
VLKNLELFSFLFCHYTKELRFLEVILLQWQHVFFSVEKMLSHPPGREISRKSLFMLLNIRFSGHIFLFEQKQNIKMKSLEFREGLVTVRSHNSKLPDIIIGNIYIVRKVSLWILKFRFLPSPGIKITDPEHPNIIKGNMHLIRKVSVLREFHYGFSGLSLSQVLVLKTWARNTKFY